ncbi:MAG: adenylyltransferase/cytidyltransferase family protein [Candidatus Peribacteraceae bacterium]
MVFGTFDWLHPGHLSLIEQARNTGEVIVIVARDLNVERIKGRVPDQNEEVRVNAIRIAVPDVTVILGDQKDFLTPIRTHRPDLILLGYDQRLPPGVEERDFGCSIERAKPHEPERYKSSKMRQKPK